MALENNTNTGRVEKMIETRHLIEKSATTNRATEAQIRTTLAPLIEALARYTQEGACQDSATAAGAHASDLTAGDFTAHRHPVLAVRCPDCGKAPGVWCRRPSGHMANELHIARGIEADRVLIDQHGPDASIERVGEDWAIDPRGHVGIRPTPEQHALF